MGLLGLDCLQRLHSPLSQGLDLLSWPSASSVLGLPFALAPLAYSEVSVVGCSPRGVFSVDSGLDESKDWLSGCTSTINMWFSLEKFFIFRLEVSTSRPAATERHFIGKYSERFNRWDINYMWYTVNRILVYIKMTWWHYNHLQYLVNGVSRWMEFCTLQ